MSAPPILRLDMCSKCKRPLSEELVETQRLCDGCNLNLLPTPYSREEDGYYEDEEYTQETCPNCGDEVFTARLELVTQGPETERPHPILGTYRMREILVVEGVEPVEVEFGPDWCYDCGVYHIDLPEEPVLRLGRWWRVQSGSLRCEGCGSDVYVSHELGE